MTLPPLLDKLLAIGRRDLLSALRYRSAFWMQAGSMFAEMAAFFFLARSIGPGFRPDGVDYYPFLLVGTSFYGFLVIGVHSFVNSVRDAQATGTMEVLMTTSTPAPVIVFLTAFSAFAGRTVHIFLYLLAGFWLFRVPLQSPNLLGCLVVFLLSMAVAISAGILAATVQVAVQKGSAVVWLFGSFAWLLTGTMFPVGSLPEILQKLSALIPVTHSLNGMRMALLQSASFPDLAGSIAVLATYALTLMPVSLYLFSRALRHARRRGTLSFY